MLEILISDELRKIIPKIRLGCIVAVIDVVPSTVKQLNYIDEICNDIKERILIGDVSKIKIISDTKDAYRQLGKDPSRYRPSAEALTRRVVQGKGLYRVNNIVDALNVISIKHGFSIGGYDIDKISGNIELGIGHQNEPYDAIGRGNLNIENLPVLRDRISAFGSPTSDSQRTMIKEGTRNFLMVFFDFSSSDTLQNALYDTESIYKGYCNVSEFEAITY